MGLTNAIIAEIGCAMLWKRCGRLPSYDSIACEIIECYHGASYFVASPPKFLILFHLQQVVPLVAGIVVAGAALAGKYSIQAWQAFKVRPRIRRFYEGGFQHTMTRREAALILGVRESTALEKVKEAHRKVMIANHPDAGGSHYLASKINEAKDVMLGKSRENGSAF
ncbi:hypothetical protein Cgig2_024742 [Carnegiea gigantea]|uniref:J domain-containing protein n=1 Tax=Carnegiea gigantea TaxID=171969 RepID=A0A9Q1JSM9_9CARY|nr:hypothetical protein Cgig2_024742 [Carnegiea gigantea]